MNWLSCKGRQMIEHTKKLVEDKFTMLGGYEHNAEVRHKIFICNISDREMPRMDYIFSGYLWC